MPRNSARAELRRARAADFFGGAWRWAVMASGVAVGAYLLLDRGIGDSVLTAAALGVLVIGVVLTFSTPLAIALLATPGLLVVQRLNFGGGDISVSDVALAAAFAVSVLLGSRPYSATMRKLLLFNLVYQFATLFTVIVNPQTQNTIEWFHAWLLVSGALVVGWSLGRGGYARTAFLLMIAAGLVIAAGTIVTGAIQYARGDFAAVYPGWPWHMQKNAAGTIMAFPALIAYVNPPWARISRRAAWWLFVVFGVAILMTQSRQALIGLIIGIIVVVMRRGVTGHSRAVLLLAIPGVWLVVAMVIDQIESQNEYNSFFQRLNWMKEVYAFWKHSPVFGHGLRFWYYEPAVPYQPPQGEIEVIASSGVVGLIGFIVMWIGIVVVLWRINPMYGTLGAAAVLSRLAQAQFDLFWVAAQVSIPFVIAGICVGALARDERAAPRPDASLPRADGAPDPGAEAPERGLGTAPARKAR